MRLVQKRLAPRNKKEVLLDHRFLRLTRTYVSILAQIQENQ